MLGVALALFLARYFSWPIAALALVYALVVLGTHGTIYLHRHSAHRAFVFRNRFWLFVARNLTIKCVSEELYVVSHHVHHRYSEKAGDPYNVNGGWLYCLLADVNHQVVARGLGAADYKRAAHLVERTGVHANDYGGYQRWGTISSPLPTLLQFAGNWAFWCAALWLIGGHALALAFFGMSAVWAVGVRTFNFDGHGRRRDRRRAGIDFGRTDLSVTCRISSTSPGSSSASAPLPASYPRTGTSARTSSATTTGPTCARARPPSPRDGPPARCGATKKGPRRER